MRSTRVGLGLLLCFMFANASEARAVAEQIAEVPLGGVAEIISTPTDVPEPETVILEWQTFTALKHRADAVEQCRSELAKCQKRLRQHIERYQAKKKPATKKKYAARRIYRPVRYITCPVCKRQGRLYHYRPERYRMHLVWEPSHRRYLRTPQARKLIREEVNGYLRSAEGRRLIQAEVQKFLAGQKQVTPAPAPPPASAPAPKAQPSGNDEKATARSKPIITPARIIIFILVGALTALGIQLWLRATREGTPTPDDIKDERITTVAVSLIAAFLAAWLLPIVWALL